MRYYGFEPLFDGDSEILIMGSFPSVISRQNQFYYGNKQNRFWKLLSDLYSAPICTVEDKKRLCSANKIALWDAVSDCEIAGSMDKDIKNFNLVDLNSFLNNTPKMRKILCNGNKAFELVESIYRGDLPIIKMPSTSPANVRFDRQIWIDTLLN